MPMLNPSRDGMYPLRTLLLLLFCAFGLQSCTDNSQYFQGTPLHDAMLHVVVTSMAMDTAEGRERISYLYKANWNIHPGDFQAHRFHLEVQNSRTLQRQKSSINSAVDSLTDTLICSYPLASEGSVRDLSGLVLAELNDSVVVQVGMAYGSVP